MFSKRHYEFLAQRFRDGMHNSAASVADVAILAEWFADAFERDNDRFDRHRFLKACGVASHQYA